MGKHFLFDYPVYEITFSYKYREDEDTRTSIRSSKDGPLTDDIDVEVLRNNISNVEH
ncbi:hypothetical protein [Paenibacillus sp. 22594]|uniref:hypothetical protein n=1 Tax=Paenibacillus sp. 22594 TaxID=3453947 RepID=UPI003F868889